MLIFCNQKAEPIKKPLNEYLDNWANIPYVIRAKKEYENTLNGQSDNGKDNLYACLKGL